MAPQLETLGFDLRTLSLDAEVFGKQNPTLNGKNKLDP
jgi:hypothetical protein